MAVGIDNGSGIQQVGLLQFSMMTVAPSDAAATKITPALTSTSAALAAPVTLTSTGAYFAGPSVTLAAGTWLLMGDAEVSASATGHTLTAKIWDGTNAAVSSGTATSSAAANYQINLPSVVVTPVVATTYEISVKSGTGTADTIVAAVGEGNTATIITAVRIA